MTAFAAPRRLSAAGWIAVLCLGVAVALGLVPGMFGLDPATGRAAGVVVGALALWATGVLPEPVTAIAFFLACILLGVAAPDVAFSGFASSAFWLVFGGLLIGMSVKRTGLGERLARALVGRIGGSYLALLAGVALVTILLAFLMPSSMGRVVLLIPVVLSLADRLGYGPGSRGRIGLILLTGMMGFNPPTAILPAVVPNMVMLGAADTLYGVSFQYFPWLVAHLPVGGFVKSLLIIGVCWGLFRQEPSSPPDEEHPGPLSAQEWRLAVILGLTLLLWSTDSLHGISPAWVALTAGLACLLPSPVGQGEQGGPLVPMALFNERFNFANLLHLAGLLALGAVVATSGIGEGVGGWLMGKLPLGGGEGWLAAARDFAGLSLLTTVVGAVATIPGVPAVMTPMAETLAQASGLPLTSVLMIQVVGYSTILLPYQVPPLIVAMQLGGVPAGAAARMTLWVFVLSVGVVWPLTFLWWQLIGIL